MVLFRVHCDGRRAHGGERWTEVAMISVMGSGGHDDGDGAARENERRYRISIRSMFT